MDKKTPIDCDVFCVGDSVIMEDLRITGRFYADCAEVYVKTLEAGEGIDITAGALCIENLLTYGDFNLKTSYLALNQIVVEGGTTINFYPDEYLGLPC